MRSMVCSSAVHLECFNFNLLRTGLTGKKEGKTRLMNMVMQVRLTDDLRYPIQYHVSSGK